MNTLSSALLSQLLSQESGDPFLTLITLEHPSFTSPIRLVNNVDAIVSRGNTYEPFPVKITLPVDDGETFQEVALQMDNVSLYLLDSIRSVTNQIQVTLEMVLASIPDVVQMSLSELKIGQVIYNAQTIQAKLYLDDFLMSSLTSEKYTPTNFSGIF